MKFRKVKLESNLSVSGAVFVDDPTSFDAESFEYFIVVTMLREFVVSLRSESGEYLSCYGSSPSLSLLVVLPLLPRRHPPRRSSSSSRRRGSSS